jgi:hypothetical protein
MATLSCDAHPGPAEPSQAASCRAGTKLATTNLATNIPPAAISDDGRLRLIAFAFAANTFADASARVVSTALLVTINQSLLCHAESRLAETRHAPPRQAKHSN